MTDTAPLPAFLEEQISAAYPGEVADRILAGLDAARERPVTLRANALKTDAGTVAGELERTGIGFARAPWYPDAFALADGVRERDVWELDIYRDGLVYLQSLSSMLPPLALAPRAGADILDMCAAPGGKTSQIAALTGGAAHLTACEMSVPRAERLEHNLAKLGCRNVQVMRTDARRLDEFFSFDQIAASTPPAPARAPSAPATPAPPSASPPSCSTASPDPSGPCSTARCPPSSPAARSCTPPARCCPRRTRTRSSGRSGAIATARSSPSPSRAPTRASSACRFCPGGSPGR